MNTHAGLCSALCVALLLAGCASAPKPAPEDTVVLLPQADGTTGALVVKRGARELQLDKPYAAARSAASGPVTVPANAETVKKDFGAALSAQPPAPISFVAYFLTGSDEFTDESKNSVDLVLVEMARRPSPEITVIGHTDRVGSDQSNDELSLQRARRIRDLLISRGIGGERINIAGRGEREPLVPTADGVAEARNRRVEFSVR
jgi:outer membrane protein OmpA-like peptidoglycan-associated protein